MITEIKIDGVGSYKKAAILKTNSKVNLIYGLNGSGKTIIGNYLSNIDEDKCSQCDITGFNREQQKILVYNEKFVEDNFYLSDAQKGIFTLAKENKEADQNIKSAEGEIQTLSDEVENPKTGLNKTKESLEGDKNDAYRDLKNDAWKIMKKYYDDDKIFDKHNFLYGVRGNKEKLIERLIGVEKKEVSKNVDEIKKELRDLDDNATERSCLDLIEDSNLSRIERDDIFQEEIVGDENNKIASLISLLNNSDWVNKGIEYFPSEGDQTCPFCQQKTLTTELQTEIRKFFDKTYSDKISKLKNIKDQYKLNINTNAYDRVFLEESDKQKLKLLISELDSTIKKNQALISKKINEPSKSIFLDSTEEKLEEFNKFILKKNIEIERFNKILKEKVTYVQKLKQEFWSILRKECDSIISRYNSKKDKLNEKIKHTKGSIDDINQKIKIYNDKILTYRKQVTNIKHTIGEINRDLIYFGIQDFEIIECGGEANKYRIQRVDEGGETRFETLSEGEKTVISFLYFIGLCRGNESPEDNKKKIIVIDDPISSLSHIYTFNVAQLIKEHFTESKQTDFIQCFILTHNLYFFHELVNKRNHQNLFRIRKDATSWITEMKRNEIRNEYEAYWDIVKNAPQTNLPFLANAMRNIIEYFFGFIDKKESINAIFKREEFKDNRFQAFKRYIQRESHSDPPNIYDFKDWDLEILQECFKKMFSDHEEHYDNYMKHGTDVDE